MIKKYAIISGIFFFIFLTANFASAESPPKEAVKYTANFEYSPVTKALPGSGGVTFVVGNVVYQSDNKVIWHSYPVFKNLEKSLKDDTSELLIAKGFSVRGPFESLDLMPYQDKKAVDLILNVAIEISNLELKDKVLEKTKDGSEFKGKITGNSALKVELREPMTRELMWMKTIPMKLDIPFIWHYDRKTTAMLKGMMPLFEGALLMDQVAKWLEQEYPKSMNTLSTLIDPEEMRVIKKQARELRTKKGY